MVQTVTGPRRGSELGVTLAHEHFIFGFPGYQGDVTLGGFDKEVFIGELKEFLDANSDCHIATVVDATPNECGRDHLFLKEVSERTGLNIICSTGYYCESWGSPTYFKMRHASGDDVVQEIRDMMRHELKVGIAGSDVRAGVIKLATSKGEMTQYEEFFFSAAAGLAAEDPSVRIITHTDGGTCALLQAQYFAERSVPTEQVAIGHVDGCLDLNELFGVAELGYYLSFDRLGMNGFLGTPKDVDKMSMVCALVASGYGDKILLSHDHIFHDLGRPQRRSPEDAVALENWNWAYVFRHFLPSLSRIGVSDEQVEKFMKANPANFYGD